MGTKRRGYRRTDLHGAGSPMEVEGELPDMDAKEMAKKGFYLVKSIIRHRWRHGWRFLTLWEGLKKLPGSPFLPSCFLRNA